MRYEIELLPHNGVAGANPVEPFAGHVELLDEYEPVPNANQIFTDNNIDYEGRLFGFAYIDKREGVTRYCFREIVIGEPSDWAKARAAELEARNA
jgi:hypothetical protein